MPRSCLSTFVLSSLSLAAACAPDGSSVETTASGVVPAGHGARLASHDFPAVMAPGERLNVRVIVENTGQASPANDWAAGVHQLYSTDNRWGFAFDPLDVTTPAGGQGVFDFVVTVPSTPTPATTFASHMYLSNEGYFGQPITIGGLAIDAAATRRWSCSFVSSTMPAQIDAGDTRRVSVTVRNSGTGTWPAAGLCLYTRDEPSYGKWGSASTCVALDRTVVPGDTHTFTFDIRAPSTGGQQTFLRQMFDSRPPAPNGGVGLFDAAPCVSLTADVIAPMSPPYQATLVSETFPRTMTTTERATATVTLRNTGSAPWTADGNFLLYAQNVPVVLWSLTHATVPAPVMPGDTATFTLPITAPRNAGPYTHAWRMIKYTGASAGFFGDLVSVPVTVMGPAVAPPNARLVSETLPRTMTPGQRSVVTITLENTGGETWTTDGAFALYSLNDPVTLWRLTHSDMPGAVPPGGQVTFSFPIIAPAAGTYAHRWRMIKFVQPSLGFFGDTISVPVRVASDLDFGIRLGPNGGWSGGTDDRFRALDIDPSGRILAAGCAQQSAGRYRGLIVRYLADGSLDTTFGGDGVVLGPNDGAASSFTGFNDNNDCFESVVADGLGRVIVAGYSRYGTAMNGSNGEVTVVARYTSSGALDTTFGEPAPGGGRRGYILGDGTGAPFYGPQTGTERFYDVDLDSQGRVIAAGSSWSDWVNRTLLARFTPDGLIDPSFNGTGFVIGDGADGIWFIDIWEIWRAVHVDAQDRVIAAGWLATSPSFTERSIMARFTANGALDPTFNPGDTTGWYLGPDPTRAGGREETFYAVTTEPNGRIVTAGFSYDTNRVVHAMTMRFTANGGLDTTFNGTGWHVEPAYGIAGSGLEALNAVAVDGSGNVLVAGFADNSAAGGFSTDSGLLLRYTGGGARDASWNPTGLPSPGAITTTGAGGQSEITTGSDDGFSAVIVDAQNRVYAAGTSGGRSLVVRYTSSGCVDQPGPCTN